MPKQLVTQYDKDPQVRQFVDQMEWYIVPLLNPDGYEYSRSSSDPEIRLWRKNRSPPKCIQQSTGTSDTSAFGPIQKPKHSIFFSQN
ncbi:hypothetical protein ANCDUO_03714 [Ancylostoma duodenale]|uniref:Peptidase M14 domain-containing protein n=1 Tax=Ancylostoma duodenale TaxID=51022 RepID=A0A0C2GWS3_9BILA|nr:hypothetical protein ANCDUO_03714 [Ancylostoma duodenale]